METPHAQFKIRRHGTLGPLLLVMLAVMLNIVMLAVVASPIGWLVLSAHHLPANPFLSTTYLAWVAGLTLAVTLAGSFYKTVTFWRGGPAVARLLRCKPVDSAAPGIDERALLETVGELAALVGVPAPRVYLFDTHYSINVFSAGRSPRDAVIGITRGAVSLLTREELRAMLAHEFSHIRGGDIRLNLRLTCLLHGIMSLGMLGGGFMSSFNETTAAPVTENRWWVHTRPGAGVALGLILGTILFASFGFLLLGIGCIGHNFARRIRDAITRQRELQADAEAAALTGNPAALARVLKKVGGLFEGSMIGNWRLEQVSHFFFCDAVSRPNATERSTHPPLAERIRRLDPAWDGEFADAIVPAGRKVGFDVPTADPFFHAGGAAAAGAPGRALPVESIRTAAAPTLAASAAPLRQSIPEWIESRVHDADGVRAIFYALALDGDRAARRQQLESLELSLETPLYELLRQQVVPALAGLAPEVRLPLLDSAAASLRKIAQLEQQGFVDNLQALVTQGGAVAPWGLLLYRTAQRRLGLAPAPPRRLESGAQSPLLAQARHCEVVLCAVAHAGAESLAEAARALGAAEARLAVPGLSLRLLPPESSDLRACDAALGALHLALGALDKKLLLEACAAGIARDRTVTLAEAIYLRLAAEVLDCQVAPLMPGQRLV